MPHLFSRRWMIWLNALLLATHSVCLCGAMEQRPFQTPQTTRQKQFEFVEKPKTQALGNDKYAITFSVKAACDVTVSIEDKAGRIVRHLASGVLGSNAPVGFQKNALSQRIIWNGKDDTGSYVRDVNALRVRVSLGLKPTFHKALGWHPENLVGTYRGIAVDKRGVYVLSGDNPQLRKYDHKGNYIKTVFPPSAQVAQEKIKGLESLEYEPGQRALHSYVGHNGSPEGLPYHAGFSSTVSGYGVYWPGGACYPQQVSLVDGYFTYATVARKTKQVWLYRLKAEDGTSDAESIAWRGLSRVKGRGKYSRSNYFSSGEFAGSNIKTALSPDGKWYYVSGLVVGRGYAGVYRLDANSRVPLGKKPWVGVDGKPGADNRHFASPAGIACDAKGRVYICDTRNNRIQVYASDAKFLKTIKIDRPDIVRVHPKTNEIYVGHVGRAQRVSKLLLTKLKSFESPVEIGQLVIGAPPSGWMPMLTLDPFSSPTRIWLTKASNHLVIAEDRGKEFKWVRDFRTDARKTKVWRTGMTGISFGKVSCDARREKLYFRNYQRFDLKTGTREGRVNFPHATDDVAFDYLGRAHVHFNPGFYMPGVARMDPGDVVGKDPKKGITIREVPYDYGIEKTGPWKQAWKGLLDVKDQRGAKFFQDGIGVNMEGDVAVQSNIYYVPKMEDSVASTFVNQTLGQGGGDHSYEGFIRRVHEKQKRGEQVYFVQRRPGRRLSGGTVWVFDRTGELRKENILPGAPLVNGVSIDENGCVYLVVALTRMVNGRAFLAGKGRVIGGQKKSYHPFTGTLIKVSEKGGEILSRQAPIPMDEWPARPPEMTATGYGWNTTKENAWSTGKSGGWVNGAEWLYAGASPIVPTSCSCPNLRTYTDWYKRTFVPEAYRHSVGIVDTAGNLIMHLGRYGNADSGRGQKSPVKLGGDEIGIGHVMYVAATDHYLCLSDMANERVTVLRLLYHQEATAPMNIR